MIELQSSGLIGKGLHRECYIHPKNKNLCVKIVTNGDLKESKREQKYYKLLERRYISWDMLSRFYGVVETNLGRGAVFDMIRNYDGAISKTIEYYFNSNEETDLHYYGLLQSFCLLKEYLLKQHIITMRLKPNNVLYRKSNQKSGRFVIVDGIGNSDLIPICNYNKYLSRKKISRKWLRFEASILETYAHNHALHRMLTAS